MRVRIKCLNDTWKKGLKDPDLTKGKFYTLLDKDVPVMNGESLYSFVGDNKTEIQRPKYLFKCYQD
jgi:hypothetical protein